MAICPACHTRYENEIAVCARDGQTLVPDEVFASGEPELAEGQMVGEYRISHKLGEGSFGSVYRAVHPLIGKTAAIKVLNRQYSSSPPMVSRFIAEARAVNQIRHRNIIDIFSFGALEDGRQFYVMELLDGMTCDAYLAQQGRLKPEQAIAILRGVARALDAAHGAGIIHRDLKPENIFLVFDEDVGIFPKLLDFGIAKLMGDTALPGFKTRTGTPMGTPDYMSPEQCRGKNVDYRTDIYSFGALVYKMLTGSVPFQGEDVMEILMKHLNEKARPLSELCPDLPDALNAPVLAMLEKEPNARPSSAGAAMDALIKAAGDAGISVPAGPAVLASSPPVIRPSSGGLAKNASAETDAAFSQAKTMALPTGDNDSQISHPTLPKPALSKRWLGLAVFCALALGAVGALLIFSKPSSSEASDSELRNEASISSKAAAPAMPTPGLAASPSALSVLPAESAPAPQPSAAPSAAVSLKAPDAAAPKSSSSTAVKPAESKAPTVKKPEPKSTVSTNPDLDF